MGPVWLCLMLCCLLMPRESFAQTDSSTIESRSPAAQVMQGLRAKGVSGNSLFVLRGFRNQWTRRQQDEVADSLTAFVIDWTPRDGVRALHAAVLTLTLASRTEGYGTRYAGAGARLQRIALSGSSYSLGGAMYGIVHLPDTTESVRIVEDLARRPGPAAELAVEELEARLGERGLAALRKLHIEGNAGTARARATVAAVAHMRGWENAPRPR